MIRLNPDFPRVALVLLAAVLLGGCASGGGKRDDIDARAQARWDALSAEDYTAAYGFLSPGYRSSVSLSQYQRKVLLQKVRWTGGKVLGSDCEEDACTVTVALDFVLIQPVPGVRRYDGTREIHEDWVRSNGKWWYVPDK